MKIDLHNYEAFFLDYREGNLAESEIAELFAFLEKYPALREELDSFEEIILADEDVFADKQRLMKPEFTNESLIAYTEGLLSDSEKREIEKLSSENRALAKELSDYSRTRLLPDAAIKFPGKNKLKRGGVVIFLQSNPAIVRAAAAIILMLGLYFIFNTMRNENNNGTKTIAATNSTEKKKEQITKVDANSDENLPQVNTSGTGTDKTYASATKKRLSPNLSDSAVSNSVQHVMSQTVTLAENKNPEKLTPDSVIKNQVPVEAISIAKNESAQSYINVASPEEDENTSVTASAKTTKQSFFGRLTDAAKKVNALGIKRVNGEDEEDSKSIIIGGLVVSESSN